MIKVSTVTIIETRKSVMLRADRMLRIKCNSGYKQMNNFIVEFRICQILTAELLHWKSVCPILFSVIDSGKGSHMDKMCKIVKKGLPESDPAGYAKLVRKAGHFCKKCGLVSNDRNRLCKSSRIKKDKEKDR